MAALDAIDTLIAQEIAEPDDDTDALVAAKAALLVWAQQEQAEYADGAGTDYAAPVTSSAHPDLITKSATVIRKALPAMAPLDMNDAEGIVTVIANTTQTQGYDLQRDRVCPGAWEPTLSRATNVKVLISHDHAALPVGRVLSLSEWFPNDSRLPNWHRLNGAGALVATFKIDLNRPAGRDLYSALKGQYVDQFSVGFLTSPDGEHPENEKGGSVRVIEKISHLFELSAVLLGASLQTQVLSIKAHTATVDPIEELFRLVGPEDAELVIESVLQEALTDRVLGKSDPLSKADQNLIANWVRVELERMENEKRAESPQTRADWRLSGRHRPRH